ncbi:tRNA epoxyqueuosine(34) reductase QueG [Phosphitispora fastidiosa]|uniref:tRNA epoxyqueuosine(34) reductase QueG n=1 Tax=Phosphitispora fastidiosa TaxID=2837202 RepID=UPI001E32EA3A|nr:epoxyqueuosine reductase [Phosphitispora fastidiosa]
MVHTDFAVLKEKVKGYAYSIGAAKIGFTDAEALTEHLPLVVRRREAGYKHGINEGDPAKRIAPLLHLPGARSVISVAVAYLGTASAAISPPEGEEFSRGSFSFISRGLDYHTVVSGKLEKIRDYIMHLVPAGRTVHMVDTGELLEKALAVKAGLGWFGRNALLVTPEFGSWVCLGELITDIPFPADRPLNNNCGSCTACVTACPTNAIRDGEDLNLDRCLACLTLGKFMPDPEIREIMGTSLYGCDICQQVCPYNRNARINDCGSEFLCSYDDAYPVLKEVLSLSKAAFRKRFGHMAGAWRGRTPIQRNAIIAAGNLGARDTIPELIGILKSDARPVLRGLAAWALSRMDDPGVFQALADALEKEKDPAVIEEIVQGLGKRPFSGA